MVKYLGIPNKGMQPTCMACVYLAVACWTCKSSTYCRDARVYLSVRQPVDGRHNFTLAVLQVCEGLILRDGVLLAVTCPSVIISQERKVVLINVGHFILLQGVITPER